MNCTEFTPLLADFVDGAVSVATRERLEGHVRECESCRGLLADLRRIKDTARKLPTVPLPDRLWASVQLRLDEEDRRVAASQPQPAPVRRLAWWPSWAMPALAALAIMVVALGTYVAVKPGPATESTAARTTAQTPGREPASTTAHAGEEDSVQSIETEFQLATEHYEKGFERLEKAAREGQGSLDPQVAAVLQKGLGIADQAVKESRAALAKEPTNELAQASLFEALRRKVGLLQETVALINEMRKGNQAEAARIVGSLGNKS